MLVCKRCRSDRFVKNGIGSGKQRHKCKDCHYRFREGDNRTNDKIVAKKALCVLLYAMAIVTEFIANGRQPFQSPDEILVENLIVRFLDYIEREQNYRESTKECFG